jgi:methylenetetrahydrofolate dehydrogenase (NADP+) / methenyltetrahydrofolate cyclohydrolase
MTDTKLIDGKAFAATVYADVARAVEQLKTRHRLTPGLAVVLVGQDPASEVYVASKGKQTREAGMNSIEIKLPAETSEADLLKEVHRLNQDKSVHGILVQMPLPKQINSNKVILAIDPDKDVDGLHPINGGRIMAQLPGLVPCTPQGSLMLIKSIQPKLAGLDAMVIGRSILFGKPMGQLLLNESCTVTMAHSKTKDIGAKARTADILVAAVGQQQMVKGDWIKPGAIVIDVGITRIPREDGKTRLVGDVDTKAAMGIAAAITPVPGGVGPMTVACLIRNAAVACCQQNGIDPATVGL